MSSSRETPTLARRIAVGLGVRRSTVGAVIAVCSLGVGLFAGATAARSHASRRSRLQVHVSASRITLGASVALTVTVTPRERGATAVLQLRARGVWVVASKSQHVGPSRLKFVFRPAVAGSFSLRVVEHAERKAAVASRVVHITASVAPTTVPDPPTSTVGPTPTVQPPTVPETAGGVTNTWADYLHAGGNQGASIPTSRTVEIECKVPGFAVSDGDTWWYRVASDPWNGLYYASADAFYNNGATSGDLIGTPQVDPAVPDC